MVVFREDCVQLKTRVAAVQIVWLLKVCKDV